MGALLFNTWWMFSVEFFVLTQFFYFKKRSPNYNLKNKWNLHYSCYMQFTGTNGNMLCCLSWRKYHYFKYYFTCLSQFDKRSIITCTFIYYKLFSLDKANFKKKEEALKEIKIKNKNLVTVSHSKDKVNCFRQNQLKWSKSQ